MRNASMRTSSCTSGFTLATMKPRGWMIVAALLASLAVVPAGATAAKRHRLERFGSCSRFVHYARRHATGELRTRGIPAGTPLPILRTPQTLQNGTTAAPESSAPTSSGGAGQDFSTTNVQEN